MTGNETSRGVLLDARNLAARHGDRQVFRDVGFAIEPGTLSALIGPNGSGKTTLLHTLCGVHREMSGDVRLAGDPLRSLSRREIARRVALVSQFSRVEFDVTVAEAVALGRYPWIGPLAPLGPRDRQAVAGALDAMGLGTLRNRRIRTLSGGERQRVFLARALAQETPVQLLDEPVANLDLRYQQETYERLRRLAAERGVAILVADHHINLAAATCSRLLVLHDGALWAQGTPDEIVTEEMIRTVFGARMRVRREGHRIPQCVWEF